MNTARRFFWLADKAFGLHTIITLACLFLTLRIEQPVILIALVVLWLLAGVVWLEWRHT
jgi:hypothetical protein